MTTNLIQKKSPLASQNCALAAFTAFIVFKNKRPQKLPQPQQEEDAAVVPLVVGVSDPRLLSASASENATDNATARDENAVALSAGAITNNPPVKHKNDTNRYTALHTDCATLLLSLELCIAASCKCAEPT